MKVWVVVELYGGLFDSVMSFSEVELAYKHLEDQGEMGRYYVELCKNGDTDTHTWDEYEDEYVRSDKTEYHLHETELLTPEIAMEKLL